MSRDTILIIGPTPPPYIGPAVNTQNILAHPALHERFDVVHVDTADRRTIENIGRFDWTNVYLAGRHGAEMWAKLATRRPRAVYLCISPSFLGFIRDLLFMLPTIWSGGVLVIHQRGGQFKKFYDESNPAMKALIRHIFRRTSRVIVLGEALRYNFEALIDHHRIVTVPNGLDPRPFLERERVRPHEPSDTFRVTYLGNLIPSKGYGVLLEAAPLVLKERPDTHFTLAGAFMDSRDRRDTERFIAEHDLSGTVTLPGVVTGDDKLDLLLQSDAFVFPSQYPHEGHPMVILEAMAAAVPVITTDHAAIAETIREGQNGYLIPKGDARALADRLLGLAADADLRRRIGAANRARLIEHYSFDVCVAELVRVISDGLADRA